MDITVLDASKQKNQTKKNNNKNMGMIAEALECIR